MEDLDLLTYIVALDSLEHELDEDTVSLPDWARMRPVLFKWLHRDN